MHFLVAHMRTTLEGSGDHFAASASVAISQQDDLAIEDFEFVFQSPSYLAHRLAVEGPLLGKTIVLASYDENRIRDIIEFLCNNPPCKHWEDLCANLAVFGVRNTLVSTVEATRRINGLYNMDQIREWRQLD